VRREGLLALLLTASLGLAGTKPGESVLAQEPPELVERLHEQGIVVMEDVANTERTTFVIAYVIFQQPHPSVVALITDGGRQTEWRTDLKSVAVVETTPQTRVDEVRMRVLFRDMVYRVRYQRDPQTDRIAWALDERFDNDLAVLEGFWEFHPLEDGRTLARFGTRVDAGAAIPAFMQRDLTRRSVVNTMENCRKWVDSNGAWRP
jgi:hypothetical protein